MIFKKARPETPIFIISFNRKWQLDKSIKSYLKLRNVKIIIHDNGSDDPEVVGYLKQLERSGVAEVTYNKKIVAQAELNDVNNTISNYFKKHKVCSYVVTDPDIELSENVPEDALDHYQELLDRFMDLESVGPMLRIDDIPREYPLYINVLNRHIDQFWGKKPEIIKLADGHQVAMLKSKIDTTFALHRKGSTFRRLTEGGRLYGKYAARHLDWYQSDFLENNYAYSSPATIAHWGNVDFYSKNKDDKLKHTSYFDVKFVNGKLLVTKKELRK